MTLRQLLALAAICVAGAQSKASSCRCRPGNPCWPAPSQWQALNDSVDGTLAAVRPVAAVCHDPTYDAAACKAVTANDSNSIWRSEQPGALQWINWEARPVADQSCYVDSPRQQSCGQGRVSLYSVLAESEEHIQQAVRFAAKNNLRLAIKNSGHDFLGRSSAPQSLQISTHKLDGITFTNDFVARAHDGNASTKCGPAVTIEAGVQLNALYKAVATKNLTVVAGLSHTVGAAGGYVQGGGHSPLGTWKGMASDNALEFRVVTAKGNIVTANDYQNQDLFWALRGGGGGTFGVVTSVTLRVFPDVPTMIVSLGASTPFNQSDKYWGVIRELHAHLNRLNGAGGSGYYQITPQSPTSNGTLLSNLTASFSFVNQTDQGAVDKLFAPLISALKNITAATTYFSLPVPLTRYFFEVSLPSDTGDDTGAIAALGSRLISRAFLASPRGPARVADALSRLKYTPGNTVTGHVVAGGAAAARNGTAAVDSALNPAWRETVTHVIFSRGWGVDASPAEQRAVQANITDVEVPLLRALQLEGEEMGAYVNEADANEAGFQNSFWGRNYPRLYKIKQRWDPHGLFIARLGVGSEDWDDEGFCRVKGGL